MISVRYECGHAGLGGNGAKLLRVIYHRYRACGNTSGGRAIWEDLKVLFPSYGFTVIRETVYSPQSASKMCLTNGNNGEKNRDTSIGVGHKSTIQVFKGKTGRESGIARPPSNPITSIDSKKNPGIYPDDTHQH